jgi:cobalt/nickel transport system permease protein
MHMSDALLSVAVGGSMTAISTVFLGYSIKKIKKIDLDEKKIPMMGVMGAFVFAAQMINFIIPGTGSSGHIGGGMLLTALLGPYAALITLASVLFIQALFFADGGLLALGCNIFNMGVVTCLIAYPLIYKPIIKRGMTPKRITVASILASIIGLQLGSFFVVLETTASGVTELPFASFVLFMQPIHLAIGIMEGIITAAVLCFVYNSRKEVLDNAFMESSMKKTSIKKMAIIFIVGTLFIGGVVSVYASSNPDGLEWSIEKVAGELGSESDSNLHRAAGDLQENTAVLPDYAFEENAELENVDGISIPGVIGGLATFVLGALIGVIILGLKRIKN